MADDQKTCSQELVLTYQRVHALRSRYAVAKKLGVTPGSVYRWMNGKGQMDETTALQIALDLGKDPMQVMSRLRLERPHTEREAQIWGRFRGRIFLAAIVALTVGQIVEAPHMGNGDQMRQAIHYTHFRRWLRAIWSAWGASPPHPQRPSTWKKIWPILPVCQTASA